ncbi:MAG: hypothetical protein ACLFU9_06390 [Candidatus Bathyarchaeia archaeon]
MKCKICDNEAVNSDYCILHKKAYQNLMEKFEAWKNALDLSWKDYLKEVIANPLTGTKAKEAAEALLTEKTPTS